MPQVLLDILRGFFLNMRQTWLFHHALPPIFLGFVLTLALVVVLKPRPRGSLAMAFFSAVFLILGLLSLAGAFPHESGILWNTGILSVLGMGVASLVALADSFLKRRPAKVFAGPVVALLTAAFTYGFMATILVANYGH